MRVGNDVVDFRDHAIPESRMTRALGKIASAEELQTFEKLLRAGSGETVYWRIWSAKETAYKIVSKRMNGLRFNPLNFHVRDWRKTAGVERGSALTSLEPSLKVDLRWESLESGLHCIGADRVGWEASVSWAVASARDASPSMVASDLAANLGLTGIRVMRRPAEPGSLGPPIFVCGDGRRVACTDLSLSDHGRFSAAAITIS